MMMRKCHLNTCPVGIATQDPELRKRFAGQARARHRYLFFVAEEVRELLASLGFRSLDELVGRVDCIAPKRPAGLSPRAAGGRPVGSISREVLYRPTEAARAASLRCVEAPGAQPRAVLDRALLRGCAAALDARASPCASRRPIRNSDRAVGAMLSGRDRAAPRRAGPAPGHIVICAPRQRRAELRRLPRAGGSPSRWRATPTTTWARASRAACSRCARPRRAPSGRGAGDRGQHGALRRDAGEAFFNGRAGERFAVRNSGALGGGRGRRRPRVRVHDRRHGAGAGPVGRNFGAGMSGGVAYVLDEDGGLPGGATRTR
jgi:glutamate synthase (NADPH/NADH) large chain